MPFTLRFPVYHTDSWSLISLFFVFLHFSTFLRCENEPFHVFDFSEEMDEGCPDCITELLNGFVSFRDFDVGSKILKFILTFTDLKWLVVLGWVLHRFTRNRTISCPIVSISTSTPALSSWCLSLLICFSRSTSSPFIILAISVEFPLSFFVALSSFHVKKNIILFLQITY